MNAAVLVTCAVAVTVTSLVQVVLAVWKYRHRMRWHGADVAAVASLAFGFTAMQIGFTVLAMRGADT